jgi:translation initiation factor IF-3
MDTFKEMLNEAGNVEKAAKMEGRQLIMFIAPKA